VTFEVIQMVLAMVPSDSPHTTSY